MKKYFIIPVFCVAIVLIGGLSTYAGTARDASPSTRAANHAVLKELPFEDRQDFEDAHRGFIAPLPDEGVIRNAAGQPVWDMTRYAFIKEGAPAPETVNPSLWRQAQLVVKGGLYKVVDGLYQVRTADLSNLTIVEGKTGIIIIDPLVSAETAKAALALYYRHRPKKPVVAVIYSHSHVDHYGGVKGVVSEADVKAGKTVIVAPAGFLEAAVSENNLAGNVMGRRAMYMYGNLLPCSPKGQVGAGLGMTTSSGTITLIAPTRLIKKTGQKLKIAGLTFEFMLAPDTEAPAEMHWFIEELKAVTAAENCCHTLHNVYTLRGARIRDPLAWSKYLDETIRRWGKKAEVMYGMHHWPVWGKKRIIDMLSKGRDGYRFINDQTLRLANKGYTMTEIAEQLKFPETLGRHFALRGYYGSLNHNVKAVYVKYLGWFDGNPANLYPLPPVSAGRKYVEYMGGAEAVIKKAREDFEKGNYRWVAEVMNRVIFADPGNKAARELQADTLEQLGYQAESGPWRNFYLTGAKELRDGVVKLPVPVGSPDIIAAMGLDLLLDNLGVALDAGKAGGKKIIINLDITDTGEKYVLNLENSALNHSPGLQVSDADLTISLPTASFNRIVLGASTLDKEVASGAAKVRGRKEVLGEMLSLFDRYDRWFNIVTPVASGKSN